MDLHGGESSKYWSQAKHLYPPSFHGLLNGTMYSPINAHAPKLNAPALKICLQIKTATYAHLTSVSLLSLPSTTLSESDVIQAHSRTYAGKIFSEPVKFYDAFTPFGYISFCRTFLGLPPPLTIGGDRPHRDFDYPVQKCLATHSGSCAYLDAHGDHASSNCPATYHPRNKKHQSLMRVIADAAQDAGLVTRCEPNTHSLLLGVLQR